MKRIHLYWLKEWFATWSLITLVLLAVILVVQWVNLKEEPVFTLMSLEMATMMLILSIPANMSVVLSLSTLLSTCHLLERMFQSHEWVVMLVMGISARQICARIVAVALGVSAFGFAMSNWWGPAAESVKLRIMTVPVMEEAVDHMKSGQIYKLNSGRWLLHGQNREGDHMKQVTLAIRGDAEGEWQFILADRMHAFEQGHGVQVLGLEDGVHYAHEPEQKQLDVTQFDHYDMIQQNGEVTEDMVAVPTRELLKQTDQTEARKQLFWRFGFPPITLLATILLLQTLHYKPRIRRFMGYLTSVAIYIGYVGLLMAGRAWVIRDSHIWMATLLPHLCVAALILSVALLRGGWLRWRRSS